MKKSGQIAVIVCVIAVVICAGVVIVISGMKAGSNHYVCLEVNPRVEFLTDKKRKVISVKPLNVEAKELLIGENFIDEKIDVASVKFIDLCARAGYIDVNGEKNAIKLTVLSGLNQGLEVSITRAINDYLLLNQILAVVVESTKDLNMYNSAKKQGVSIENYDLIKAVTENDNSITEKELKGTSNKKLIEMIANQHNDYKFQYTTTELSNKFKLIDFNRQNYNKHINSISDESRREFKEKFVKFIKSNKKDYELNYDKKYNIWLENL